jgi:hypothetical protein
VDLFKLISGPPDLYWHSVPWAGLLASMIAMALLGLLTVRVIETRDFR